MLIAIWVSDGVHSASDLEPTRVGDFGGHGCPLANGEGRQWAEVSRSARRPARRDSLRQRSVRSVQATCRGSRRSRKPTCAARLGSPARGRGARLRGCGTRPRRRAFARRRARAGDAPSRGAENDEDEHRDRTLLHDEMTFPWWRGEPRRMTYPTARGPPSRGGRGLLWRAMGGRCSAVGGVSQSRPAARPECSPGPHFRGSNGVGRPRSRAGGVRTSGGMRA